MEDVHWRLIFYINIPIGVLGIILASLHLRETGKSRSLPFDYKGFMLSGIGFSTALVALTRAPQDGWNAANIVALLAVSVVALSAWIVVGLRAPSLLLDLRLLRHPLFTVVTGINFVIIIGFYVVLFFLTQFLQHVRQLSALDTGLVPEQVTVAVLMPLGGRLYDKIGARLLLITGLIALGYATLQLHSLDVSTSNATLRHILILRGMGLGLIAMPVITLALSLVPPAQVARASALINVLRQLVLALGLAAAVTLRQARQVFHFDTLTSTVTPGSLAAAQVLASVAQAAAQHGVPPAMAEQIAMQALNGLAQGQADVAAFDDLFLVLGMMLLTALAPTLFLRQPRHEHRHHAGATAPSATETAD